MKRIEFKAGPEGLENKFGDARVEVKASGEDGILHIKAYALAFGNIDSWGDIIMPGACDEFLKSEDADRMALCYQHDRRTVIGKITDKGVDDYANTFTYTLNDNTSASAVQVKLFGTPVTVKSP